MVDFAVSYEVEFWDDVNSRLHKKDGYELVEAKNLFKAFRIVSNKLDMLTPEYTAAIYLCCGSSTYSWTSPKYRELKERDAESRL